MEAQDQEVVSEPLPTTENDTTVEDLQVDQKAVEAEEREPTLGGALEKDSLTEISSEVVEDPSRGDVDSVEVPEQVKDTASTLNSTNTCDTADSEAATEPVTYEDNKHNGHATLTAPPSKSVSTNGLSTETPPLDTHLTNDVVESKADIAGSQDKDIDASISVPAKETLVPEEKRVPISVEVQDVTATEEAVPAVTDPVMESPKAPVINEDNTPEIALTAATEGSITDTVLEESAAIPDPTTNHDGESAIADTLSDTKATPDVVTEEPAATLTEFESEPQSSAEVVVEETSVPADLIQTPNGATVVETVSQPPPSAEDNIAELVAETVSQLPPSAEDNIVEPVAGELVTTAVDGIEESEPSDAPPSNATKTIVLEEPAHAEQKLVEVAPLEESAADAMNSSHSPAISENPAFVVEEAHEATDITGKDSIAVPEGPEPSEALSRDATDVHAEQPVEALEEPITTSVEDSPSPAINEDTTTINDKDSIVELEPLPSGASTATEIALEEPLHAEEKAIDVASLQEPGIAASNRSQSPAVSDIPASVIGEPVRDDQTPDNDAATIIAEIESEPSHAPPTETTVRAELKPTEAAAPEEPDTTMNGSQSLAMSEDPTIEESVHDIPQINSAESESSEIPPSEATVLEDSVHAEVAVLEEPVPMAVDSSQTLAMSEEPTFVAEESALHTGDNDAGLVETPVVRNENNMTSDAVNYSDSSDAVVAPSNSEPQVMGDGVLEELTPAESGIESAPFVTEASNPDGETTVAEDETQSAFTNEPTTEEFVTEQQPQSKPTPENEGQLAVEAAGVSDEENTPEDATTITQVVEGVKDMPPLHDVVTELDHDSGTVNVHAILESRSSPVREATTEAPVTEDEPSSQPNPVRDDSLVVVAETQSPNKEDSIAEDDPSGAPNESQPVADEAILFEESIPANVSLVDSIVAEEPNHDVDVLTTDSAHQPQPTPTEAPTEDVVVENPTDSEPPATSGDIEIEETSAPGRDDSSEEHPATPDSVNSQAGAAGRENQLQSLGIETPKEIAAVDPTPSSEELSGAAPEGIITEPVIIHTLATEDPAYHRENEAESAAQELLSNHDETAQVEQETEIHMAASQPDENCAIDDTIGEATVQELHIHDTGSDSVYQSQPPVKPEAEGLSNDYDSEVVPATVQTSEAPYGPDEIVPSSNEAEQTIQPTEASDENTEEVEASVPPYIPPPHEQEATLIDEQPVLVISDSPAVDEQPSDVLLASEAAVPPVDMGVTEGDDTSGSSNIPEAQTEIVEESAHISETNTTAVENAPVELPIPVVYEPHGSPVSTTELQRLEPEPQAVRASVTVSLEDDVSSSLEAVSPPQLDLSTTEKYIEPSIDDADVPVEPFHTDYDEAIAGESGVITNDLAVQPPITDPSPPAASDVTNQEVVDNASDRPVSHVEDTDATGLESSTQSTSKQAETGLGVIDLVASVESDEGSSSRGMVEVTKQGAGAELDVDDEGREEESTAAASQPLDSRTETLPKVLAETPADEQSTPANDLSVSAQAGTNTAGSQGDVSSTGGELAEPVLQLHEHATPVTDSIEAIRTEVVPQTLLQQTDREVVSTTLSPTPLAVPEVNLVIHGSSADTSKVEAAIDANPMQVVAEAHEPDHKAQEDIVAFSEVTAYEKQGESSLAINDATQAEETSSLNTHNASESSLLTDRSATDEVFGASSLLPSSVEIERPKSPWTPSYSVTTQGPGIVPEEEIETEILSKEEPLTVSLTVSTESGLAADSPAVEIDRPRSPWTPSYSVHVQGSPRPETTNIEVEPSAVTRDVLTEADVPKPIANEHEHEEVQLHPEEHAQKSSQATVDEDVLITPEPSDAADKVQFPRVDDTNEPRPPIKSKPSLNVIGENVEDNTVSQPLNVEISPSSPRSRLESTTSSLFFPGGWFAKVPQGRASLDNAQGEFIPAKTTPVTAQPDAAPLADAHHGDAHEKKGRWCILM